MSQLKPEMEDPETLRYVKNLRLKEDISSEERHILNQTVHVDKGLLGEVVTIKKEKNDLLYTCHICETFKMVWSYFVVHLDGNNHKLNLKKIYHPKIQFPIKYPNENLKMNLKTEPLPVCKIQEELDKCVLPLIGLEYLVEIVVPDGSLQYQCLLCNKKSSSLIIDHFICQGHYMRYLSIFFPTVTKFLKRKIKVIGGRIITKKNTADVVTEIQREYGLLKPRRTSWEKMETSWEDVLDSIDRGPHFWETPTRTFLEDVNGGGVQQSNLKKLKSKNHDKQIMPLMSVMVSPPKLKGLTHNTYERLAEERFDEDEFIQPDCDTQLWQNYRERVKQIEDDLYYEMTYYEQNPERHPKFEIEWKIYLSERTEDAISNGEDPRMYNIKDEFLVLWQIRLREMFNNIFIKEEAQLRLEIEFSLSKSLDNAWLKNEFENYKKFSSNKRDYGSLSYENKFSSTDHSNKRIKEDYVGLTSDVSVVHVLRQLSVLEANLGSLGPKVVDLLSQAISLEKSSSENSVLSIQENCLMLETVKEKLIGLLQAKMMEQSMIGITETAIHNITDLLLKVPSGNSNYDNKPSFSAIRPSHDEKPNLNGRKPYREEKKPYMEYRKSYLDERQPYQDEMKPFMADRKPYLEERQPYQDKRKPQTDQSKSNPFESRFYPDIGQLNQDKRNFSDVRNPYPDDWNCCHDKGRTYEDESNSFRDKRIPQIKKTYKLSEIHYFIKNLRSLLEFSYVKKATMAQEIASSLLLRRQTDITEDDLLVMINTYKSIKQEPRDEFCGKQSIDNNQQRLSVYNKFSSADNVSPKTSSAIPSLFDVPAYAALDDLFKANQSSHSSFGQEIKNSYFPGSDHNSSVSLSYSFNTNPYPLDSYRKY